MHRWYPQRTLLRAPRFGDVVPSDALRPVTSGAQRLAQVRQIGVQIARVLRDRDVVHPCRSVVGRHLRERQPQRCCGVDFVDQTVPFAAFDPPFEGRQHPLCPHPRFGSKFRGSPDRSLRRLVALAGSAVTSPFGHYRRSLPVARQRVSIFLHSLAPPALPGFIATMSAVTPARGHGLLASSALLQPCRSPCFTQSAFRALCLQPPTRSHGRFNTYPLSAMSFPTRRRGLGFTLVPQARQTVRPNRVCHPTDRSFASCCSPPRLAAAQLRSATGRSRYTWEGLAPPDRLHLHAHGTGLRR